MTTTKHWQRVLIGMAGTLLAVGMLPACGPDAEPPAPVIRPVRTLQVWSTGSERPRSFSGTTRAAVESRLSFKVAGTVQEMRVAVGDRVLAGQVIARLDDRDFQLQVQEAKARLNSAQAQARNADASYARVRGLYENRNASLNDLEAAQAGAVSARENANSIAKGLELVGAQLEYTRLVAQMDGDISEVRVEPNENVAPGQPVVTLASGQRLEVEVAIPGVLIAQIREGDGAVVRLDAVADQSYSGRVSEVGVAATGVATTFPVTVRLEGTGAECRPGMAAEVELMFGGGGRDRLYVPGAAVGEDQQDRRFVYVVEPGEEGLGQVRRREVEVVEEPTSVGLEVTKGLADGELVVTAGVTRIEDGQKVRLLEGK